MSWSKQSVGLLMLAMVAGCDKPPAAEHPMLEIHGRTMGTFYGVKVVGDFPGGQQALQTQVDSLLKHYNDEISTYDPNSSLSKFNQQQTTAPFPVSQDMADIVISAVRVGQRTQGVLDVTVGPLVNLWGFGPDRRPVKIPTDAQITAARQRVGIQRLHVDVSADHAELRKDIPNMYVDLSTVGEGFGADKIADFLESRGVHNYLVEIAGASRSRGVNAKGEPWKLAIQKPTDELDEVQAIVKPDGRAISTSGSYRNYYELNGQRYSHIIDPATGKPITHRLVSATVITPTALEADGLDTALMVMGPEKAMAFAKQQHLAVYLVIKTDKGFKAEYSETFKPYLVQ
ncbi:FAD:protein FMN transferase [uncultured Tolumonas sp.]|uniref:FAD:protein FMN transferase n=1 Tax=uncultured Tolumonas sp. TaxID=263765 RepID=UPI003748797A